jgi:hypothetical protein
MRRALTSIAALLVTATLVVGTSPAALAADLSGSWSAVARRGGGIGYSMTLTPKSTANSYAAVLRFHYQDGRIGPRIKGGLFNMGNRVFLLLNDSGTSSDMSNPNVMRGTLGQDGSLYFPTCYKQLKFVTKKAAPQMCLFQQLPT